MFRWINPRRVATTLSTLVLPVAVVALAPAPAQAAGPARTALTPYCGIWWGSLDKTATASPWAAGSSVRNARAGEHPCYDRAVVDLSGRARTATVRYVENVRMDGSGNLVPLRGGAKLEIVVQAPSYDDRVRPTYVPANPREAVNVTGYRTFRQLAWAGSFEGQTTFGLGVRARLPMRVFLLDGPGRGSRVVIDVAHRW